MRIKLPISLVFAFTLIVLNACAVLEPSDVYLKSGESLVDALINLSLNESMPKMWTPAEERAIEWRNSSILKTPTIQSRRTNTPSEGVAEKKHPADRSEFQGQVKESPAALISDTTVAGSPVETQNSRPSSANLAGTWSLDLNDTPSKQVSLTLSQIKDNVLGSGSMKNGNDILAVTASGALKEDHIYLDITSNISLYRLVMTSSGDRGDFVSGDYNAYMPDGRTWVGKVQGKRALPKLLE
jgi:hypothetical protein